MGTKKVKDIAPGDLWVKAPAKITKVTKTLTQITIETEDGRSESFDLAQDPAIEIA